ncbi:MAG: ABC-type transport auxiliary lipoprotein family protein [Sedimentisphaerales bacterium]
MIGRWSKLYVYLTFFVSSIMLMGCGQRSYSKRSYILDAARQPESGQAESHATLDVRRFTIDSVFADKGFVYRRSEHQYESDFYNQFLISPAIMVSEKTRHWLCRSGVFERVLVPGSRLESTHTLEANITALYADVRDKSSLRAVMELRAFLIANDPTTESVVLGETYKASCPLQSDTPDALVEALDKCLAEILTSLEKDLKKELSPT